MPRELKLTRDHFAKKKVSLFDCLLKTQTAFKFEPGRDFRIDAKPKNVVFRLKQWARSHDLRVLTTIESDGSVIAWTEALTEEELAVRRALSETARRRFAARSVEQQ